MGGRLAADGSLDLNFGLDLSKPSLSVDFSGGVRCELCVVDNGEEQA